MPDLITPPSDAVKPGLEPAIFTMPERYRGGAMGTAMVVPKSEASTAVPSKPVPPPPPPKPSAQNPKPMPPHGKPHGKIAVLVGVAVLLVLGVAGFFLLRATQAPKPAPPVTPPTQPVTPPVTPPTQPVTPPVVTPPVNPFPTGTLHSGADADSDGLTDVEESVLYNTDSHLPDTDGDGFLDGNEVFNLYDPKVPSPATLRGDGITKPFDTSLVAGAPSLPYVIDYPSIWTPQAVSTDPLGVSFGATTGETVTLTVQPKTTSTQTLAEWYAAQSLPTASQPFTTKNGLSAIASDDQLTVYVDAKAFVIILKYDAGIKDTIDYLQTFKMMQNSLKVK